MLRAIVIVIVVALPAVLLYGSRRWHTCTQELRARLEAARVPVRPQAVDFRELEGLPAPVRRYFRAALTEGQPLVSAVSVEHTGIFNMSDSGEQWRPFTSTQRIVTRRPGFVWDGRIALVPGVAVHVHDAYVAGEGILHPALFGLITLADLRDTGGEVARGELMRFFAEVAWYPTALLPSQGVRWEPVDEHAAKATLIDGELSLTMLFRFGDHGFIESVQAEHRGRTVGGQVIPTPWEGRFSNYQERSGMHVPLRGEVAWLLPEGRKPYWRGRITKLVYDFARSGLEGRTRAVVA
jgi:uncharacterized protein DUF6920